MDRSSRQLQELDSLSGLRESPTKSLFKPFNIHMHYSGLHVYNIEGREAIPSGAASGLQKTSGSGHRRPHGVILGYARQPLRIVTEFTSGLPVRCTYWEPGEPDCEFRIQYDNIRTLYVCTSHGGRYHAPPSHTLPTQYPHTVHLSAIHKQGRIDHKPSPV